MAMKCPHCGETFTTHAPVLHNADQYDKACIGRSYCCGRAVRVTPIRTYKLTAVNAAEDDWGYACEGDAACQ